jgi:hypothetical protein
MLKWAVKEGEGGGRGVAKQRCNLTLARVK